MAELTLIIFGLILALITKPLWKPYINSHTTTVQILTEEQELANQTKLVELRSAIEETINQNGEWLDIDKLQHHKKRKAKN